MVLMSSELIDLPDREAAFGLMTSAFYNPLLVALAENA